MEKKSYTVDLYWTDFPTLEKTKVGTLRKANVENMQQNIVPYEEPLKIAARLANYTPDIVFVKQYREKETSWEDVWVFIKNKFFFRKRENLKSLFRKEKEDVEFSEWTNEIFYGN